ncbi:hypothetical protein MPC4_70131 [Methylocella tundrae]|uniref:Uncharacterized protein n=1 Tax=Methylocella tundrae TaxID=227605 RepID=A0A8B6MB66_METTU|nr:hypothetical protein MPC4_70131 [Methylocella tundrae]
MVFSIQIDRLFWAVALRRKAALRVKSALIFLQRGDQRAQEAAAQCFRGTGAAELYALYRQLRRTA